MVITFPHSLTFIAFLKESLSGFEQFESPKSLLSLTPPPPHCSCSLSNKYCQLHSSALRSIFAIFYLLHLFPSPLQQKSLLFDPQATFTLFGLQHCPTISPNDFFGKWFVVFAVLSHPSLFFSHQTPSFEVREQSSKKPPFRSPKRAAFMDWDSKMTLWELPELEQNDAEANLSLDCSVDLKLGGLGDLGLVESWKEQRRASSAASSSKRQRAPSNSNQTVLCLVDDCKSDLSSCKEYHRRHKVCELHSKTPVVVVGGQEQRFCQQCSRFHLLMEFDEVKRSCRKRLDGHNRRRRKPQVEAINSGNLYSTQHASRFTSYPQNFQNARSDAAWTSMVKIEDDVLYPVLPPPTNQFVDAVQQPPSHRFAAAFNPNYKEGEQFFLHDGRDIAHGRRMTMEPATVCQPLLNTISSTAESSNNNMMFSESQVFNSDCALSLLSSSAQSSGVNQSHMVPADRIPMGQPLLSNLRYGVTLGGYSPSPMEEEHVRTVLVPDSGEADLHCQSMFQLGDKGDSDCASESLPFSWQ